MNRSHARTRRRARPRTAAERVRAWRQMRRRARWSWLAHPWFRLQRQRRLGA